MRAGQVQCPTCLLFKALEDFPSRGKGTHQRRKKCKVCYGESRKLSYRKHYAKVQNQRRRKLWKEDPAYRERNKVASSAYRKKNRHLLREKTKERHRKSKLEVIRRYGGACACCGESQPEFLSIDHVNNDGAAHRREIGASTLYHRLARQEPDFSRYRILCYNCNCAIGFFGYCPHERKYDVRQNYG